MVSIKHKLQQRPSLFRKRFARFKERADTLCDNLEIVRKRKAETLLVEI